MAAPRKAPALQGFAGIHHRRKPPAAPAKPAGWGSAESAEKEVYLERRRGGGTTARAKSRSEPPHRNWVARTRVQRKLDLAGLKRSYGHTAFWHIARLLRASRVALRPRWELPAITSKQKAAGRPRRLFTYLLCSCWINLLSWITLMTMLRKAEPHTSTLVTMLIVTGSIQTPSVKPGYLAPPTPRSPPRSHRARAHLSQF